MNAAVLDASIVVKWFRHHDEHHLEQALAIRESYAAGALTAYAPTLMRLEILNAAGRRWEFPPPAVAGLAALLDQLRFEFLDPEVARIAPWVSAGLTAYDASYVALAERERVPLVTEDAAILRIAPDIAVPLAETSL